MQKDIEMNRTALIKTGVQPGKKRVTVEEQINRELEAQSINSEERANRVTQCINAIDLEYFVQVQERLAEHQENPEDYSKNIQSNKLHVRKNQMENDL